MTTFIKITEENDELYHFGIPGMHWGHRKTSSTLQKIGSVKPIKAIGAAGEKAGNAVRENNKKRKAAKIEKNTTVTSTPHRKAKIGAAIVGGIIASNLTASALSNVTLNKGALLAAGVTAGVLGGKKMYELMTEHKE